jgi:hypothetical protein
MQGIKDIVNYKIKYISSSICVQLPNNLKDACLVNEVNYSKQEVEKCAKTGQRIL